MTAQGINRLRALTNQQLSGTENHRLGLLLWGLDRNKPHPWSRGRFTDRFGIVAVILPTLWDIRFDALGRDQLNPMAERAEKTPPVMGPASGF
jgi:hypothetical protein